jgi:threonine/homoserine/homoserine lactone efflux protein
VEPNYRIHGASGLAIPSMNLIESVAGVLGALAVGAVSPGPSFVFVARTSVAGSRAEGLAAAVGMGIGGIVFASLVMLGLRAVLLGVPWLFLALKIMGGCYLIYMAFKIFRGAAKPLIGGEGPSLEKATPLIALRRALFTQLSNPKAAVVYGSIFAALLPADLPRSVALALPLLVFCIEAGWYSIVALALSSRRPRSAYLRFKTSIDRVAGGVLGLLGVKLLVSASPSR